MPKASEVCQCDACTKPWATKNLYSILKRKRSRFVRYFLYEFITGGGLVGEANLPDSLLREGRAMIEAVAADFLSLSRTNASNDRFTEVVIFRDHRLANWSIDGCTMVSVVSAKDEREKLECAARHCHGTLLIAPEFDDLLLSRARWAEQAQAKLLSPSSATIEICGDKHALAKHLRQQGVQTPFGRLVRSGEPLPSGFQYPAILKPRDGAGSLGLLKINSSRDAVPCTNNDRRIERFIPGIFASASVLCGPQGITSLRPSRQRLCNRTFAYLGAVFDLGPALEARAARLACDAVATLEAPRGYLGVDLVLGDAPSGQDDHVIEINPRLTTSYVGLRRLCRENLAAAMIATARGEPVASLSFDEMRLEFDA